MANKQNKTHDWDQYQQDFFKSKHVTVSQRARAKFDIKKGIPGRIGRNTKGWAQQKKKLGTLALEEAREEAKGASRSERVAVINEANQREMELIKHICDIVKNEITDKKTYKEKTLSIQKMDFILSKLRLIQGKANEYLGSEVEEKTELDKIMEEQGFLPVEK